MDDFGVEVILCVREGEKGFGLGMSVLISEIDSVRQEKAMG